MTQLTKTERETEALRQFVHNVADIDPEAVENSIGETNYEYPLRRLIEDAQYLVRALRVPRTTSGGTTTEKELAVQRAIYAGR